MVTSLLKAGLIVWLVTLKALRLALVEAGTGSVIVIVLLGLFPLIESLVPSVKLTSPKLTLVEPDFKALKVNLIRFVLLLILVSSEKARPAIFLEVPA